MSFRGWTLSRSFATSAAFALALLIAAGSGPASARPTPTPTPTATPVPVPEDPAVTTIARREFVSWQAGVVDKSRYSEAMQGQITDDQVTQTSKNLSEVGALQHAEWVGLYAAPPQVSGGKAYVYRMVCTNHPVYEVLVLGADHKIAGILFRDKFP
jgi:hypothetical protein